MHFSMGGTRLCMKLKRSERETKSKKELLDLHRGNNTNRQMYLTLTNSHPLAGGLLWAISQRCDLVQTLQRGVSRRWRPPHHRSNGLEEIPSQIKQTRWKMPKNLSLSLSHTQIFACWKLVILPWATNKTAC